MVYDPAWDMPRINWAQQGSFEEGEIPPATDPDAGTLVCLPPISQAWLPYILGAIDQLRNPSTWIVADDDAMYATLARVDRLKEMIGGRAACIMYSLRFTSECVLQFSTDGGATWSDVTGWATNYALCIPPPTQLRLTDGCELQDTFDAGLTWAAVPGWNANFGPCVQSAAPIIGLPPNPGDQSPDQLACSIAKYLAEQVIIGAMGKAVTAVSDDLSLLNFGLNVLTLIPEFVMVTIAADAFAAIYVAVQEGTLSDYEAALTDATLLSDLVCAVYGCIRADGYVKPGNFACITTAVGLISYAHHDVIVAIGNYLTALGAKGLAQLSQIAGLETGADCSTCGLCWRFDFEHTAEGWFVVSGAGEFVAGGFQSLPGTANDALQIESPAFASTMIHSVRITGGIVGVTPSAGQRVIYSQDANYNYTTGIDNPLDVTLVLDEMCTKIGLAAYNTPHVGNNLINSVYVEYTGTAPWTTGAPC